MSRIAVTGPARLALGAATLGLLAVPLAGSLPSAHPAGPATVALTSAVAPPPLGGGASGQATLTKLQSGTAVRPSGSDSSWPRPGTRVNWTVVRPIQDLLDQGRTYGYTNLGTIGNTSHLRKHGDHTPWSAGKVRGRIYAKDTRVPADFERWLVAKCKSSYNTLWIDFFNVNGRQYDRAGRYLGPSGDQHLHISVRKGYENTRVTLFRDYHRQTGH